MGSYLAVGELGRFLMRCWVARWSLIFAVWMFVELCLAVGEDGGVLSGNRD